MYICLPWNPAKTERNQTQNKKKMQGIRIQIFNHEVTAVFTLKSHVIFAEAEFVVWSVYNIFFYDVL